MATVHESAKNGDLRSIQKWIETEGDIDRKYDLRLLFFPIIIIVTIIIMIVIILK